MSIDLQSDMDNIFLNVGFEEDVFYNGNPIKAIIDRTGLGRSSIKGNADSRGYDVEILVSSSDVHSVKLNFDEVQVMKKSTDISYSKMLVIGLITSDSGAYRLGLR